MFNVSTYGANDYQPRNPSTHMTTERDSKTIHLTRIILVVLAVVLLAPLLMMAFMMPMMGMMGGMWSDGATMMSPLWNIAMMLLFLLVLIGIGYLVYRAITRGLATNVDPALEELRLTLSTLYVKDTVLSSKKVSSFFSHQVLLEEMFLRQELVVHGCRTRDGSPPSTHRRPDLRGTSEPRSCRTRLRGPRTPSTGQSRSHRYRSLSLSTSGRHPSRWPATTDDMRLQELP